MGKNKTARKRALLTGQSHQHALMSLKRDRGQGAAPIPVAPIWQAAFEALLLERIGEWDPDFWCPGVLPFGITWVDPSPYDLTIAIPRRYLPDLIRQLIPTIDYGQWHRPRDDDFEFHGVPGLRFRYENCYIVLYRPGQPARVKIPLENETLWHKAIKIATAEFPPGTILPWDTNPQDWHPAETYYSTVSWPARYAIEGEHYQASRLASDLLRRLPGICKPFVSHDMWFNFYGSTAAEYHIQLEWQNSQPPHAILDLILDRKFGLDVQLELVHDQESEADCYTDQCRWVRLRSMDESGSRIDLRYLKFEPVSPPEGLFVIFEEVRQQRLELEHKYGYPSSLVS
ncbi:hypothetical protein [Streptosporangium canum]|uniref:hypothetical protein n=1 Tax=Streptosporangium canum TaxID=324952 RepID=UPI0037BA3004